MSSYRITQTLDVTEFYVEYHGTEEGGDDLVDQEVSAYETFEECRDRVFMMIAGEVERGETGGDVVVYLDEARVNVGVPDCCLIVEWSTDFDSITEW